MAFKMKGSPMHRNYGIGAPTKKVEGEDPPADDRSWTKRAWDKATQYGQGAKAFVNELATERNTTGSGMNVKHPMTAAKIAFDKEKKHDERHLEVKK
jgi:hypothetical protein